jgi:hypothetical protein
VWTEASSDLPERTLRTYLAALALLRSGEGNQAVSEATIARVTEQCLTETRLDLVLLGVELLLIEVLDVGIQVIAEVEAPSAARQRIHGSAQGRA